MKYNKYHARKTKCTNGHIHDSSKEAARCNELHLLQKAGAISRLQIQVRYELIPARKYADMSDERSCDYIADFVYNDGENLIIEDTKGRKTKEYIIKRKLLKEKYCQKPGIIFRET